MERPSSGQVPRNADGSLVVGKCGSDDFTDDEAVEAARVVGLTMLATMRQQLGSLDVIARVVKVNGFVNCTSGAFYKIVSDWSPYDRIGEVDAVP